jgi:hypothetical protein
MIGFIACSLQLQSTIPTHNQWLRLAPFLTGLRVSSLLRDWLGSDLRIGYFFSFRCPLVNNPQLNTELNYWTAYWILLQLPEWFHELTNESSCTTRGEPKRDHHLELFICYYLFHPLLRNVSLASPYLSIAYSASIRCHGNVLTEPLSSKGHIRHNILCVIPWMHKGSHILQVMSVHPFIRVEGRLFGFQMRFRCTSNFIRRSTSRVGEQIWFWFLSAQKKPSALHEGQSELNTFSPKYFVLQKAISLHITKHILIQVCSFCMSLSQWPFGLKREVDRWDRGFESHTGHGCLRAFILCLCCYM